MSLRLLLAGAGVCLALVADAGAAWAQTARRAGTRLEGFQVEAGLVDPKHGSTSFLFGASANLGTLFVPWLDLAAGLRYWSADIDRSAFGSGVDGTFSDFNIYADLQYPILRVRGLRPFLVGGISGHFVGADIPGDRSLEDAISGFNLGVNLGFGVATTRPGLGARLMVRRDFVEDAGNWNYVLGAGWWPKSRAQAERRVYKVQSAPATTQVVQPQVSAPAVVASPAPQTPPVPQESLQADRNVQELLAKQRAMQAELDSLRQNLAATKAAPPEEPTLPAPVPEPAEMAPTRLEQLQAALERTAALSGQSDALRRIENGFTYTPNRSLLFKISSSELQIEAQEELRRLASVMVRFPEFSVVVAGHTDSIGDPEANRLLSERRAEAVRAELIRLGVRRSQVEAVGYGSQHPVADNATADGRSRNRRVELIITQ